MTDGFEQRPYKVFQRKQLDQIPQIRSLPPDTRTRVSSKLRGVRREGCCTRWAMFILIG